MAKNFNPYIAGNPLRTQRGFYGRQDIIDWVVTELRNEGTNAIVLFGQRRIGKTTLLLQIKRLVSKQNSLPVYFDLQDKAKSTLVHVLTELANSIADELGIDPPDENKFDPEGRYFRLEFLPAIYKVLDEKCRPVFLLDEFDVLDQAALSELPDTAAAKSLFPFLRSLMNSDPRPAFVFVVGRRTEDLALNFTTTFKASSQKEIWLLDPESAEKLIRQAEANGSLAFSDEAVQRILKLTNGHPYLTQLVCQRLWEKAHASADETANPISLAEVNEIVPDALEVGKNPLLWLWDGLTAEEKIYASALAEISEEGQGISKQDVINVMVSITPRLRTRRVETAPNELVKRRILQIDHQENYSFAVELFRRWVKQNKPLREMKDELDRSEPVAASLFAVGQSYFNNRKLDEAARHFKEALDNNPNHFQARLMLGEVYYQQNLFQVAIEQFQEAYQKDMQEARYPLLRALIAEALSREQAGDEKGALEICEKALKISAKEKQISDLQGRIWTKRGEEAIRRNDLRAAAYAFRQINDKEKLAKVVEMTRIRELAQFELKVNDLNKAEEWDTVLKLFEEVKEKFPEIYKDEHWNSIYHDVLEQQKLLKIYKGCLQDLEEGNTSKVVKDLTQLVSENPYFKDALILLLRLTKGIDVHSLKNSVLELTDQNKALLEKIEALEKDNTSLTSSLRIAEFQLQNERNRQKINNVFSSLFANFFGANKHSPGNSSVEHNLKPKTNGADQQSNLTSICTFRTTYELGNDLFDESTSIDSDGGEFLGECGIGISETIGPGKPSRPTAFEVWLFDKNDILTITHVLCSQYVFNDPVIAQRLSSKGETVLTENGTTGYLQTATLVLEYRVSEFKYGTNQEMHPNSYFEKLTIELKVSYK